MIALYLALAFLAGMIVGYWALCRAAAKETPEVGNGEA